MVIPLLANQDLTPMLSGNLFSLQKTWTDEFLTWDPSNHSGVHTANVNRNKVWKPEVVLYNRLVESLLVLQNFSTVRKSGNMSEYEIFW